MLGDDMLILFAVMSAIIVALLIISLVCVSGSALLRRLGLSHEPLFSDIFAPPQVIPQKPVNRQLAQERGDARRALQERYDRLALCHQQWSQGVEACWTLAAAGRNTEAFEGRLQQLADDIAAVLPKLSESNDPSKRIAQRADGLCEDISQALQSLPTPRRNYLLLLLLIVLLLLIGLTVVAL
ncbi:MAG: hypothetical protein EA401_06740 [Planctomycetota bacterium]|nr:MAG: hypothetical protein EA401_06740 [Planctomycetota bacterium]